MFLHVISNLRRGVVESVKCRGNRTLFRRCYDVKTVTVAKIAKKAVWRSPFLLIRHSKYSALLFSAILLSLGRQCC